MHGTHQDRLVKKLRRQEIDSHAQANAYLQAEYLPEHNRRFARPAAQAEDYHRRTPCAAKLDKIFRLESERTISDDWVVRYDNRFFQLEPQSRHYAPAKGKVVVCKGREGSGWRAHGRDTAVVGLALRFALDAPPCGLRRASLRPEPARDLNTQSNHQRISEGTLLTR